MTERQARWVKNICIVVILVDVFSGFGDRYKLAGAVIAAVAGVVMFYVIWKYLPQSEPEPEEPERENEHYMTIRELVERLEEIEDDTSVVVDSSGYPITSVTILADGDFGDATWLRGFENSRQLYRDSKTKG